MLGNRVFGTVGRLHELKYIITTCRISSILPNYSLPSRLLMKLSYRLLYNHYLELHVLVLQVRHHLCGLLPPGLQLEEQTM